VSFDIDADGILNVSAKDKGTGKEQNIVIKSSGGLSEDDIEKMVRDAEANAEADVKRRQTIEAKNEIDSLVYSTEKSLIDNGDKLDAETKSEVEKAIAAAKEAKEGDDLDKINSTKEALSQASMKIGQAVYNQQKGNDAEKKDENTQDAEFKEKSDEEKKDK
jgi:molecular chaperone DnaK